MKKLYYPAIFQKESSGYSVWMYDFKGCVSQGENLAEAIQNITEALGIFIEEYKNNNIEIPNSTDPEKISDEIHKEQFISLIEFDWFSYSKKYDNKAVKKTLTIPNWLNTVAEKQGINFSQTLQEALKQQLNL